MALNYIWVAFFLIAFIIALIRLIFFGDTDMFATLSDQMLATSKSSVMDIALPLAGNMVLWLGIMNIGERAGAINFLSRVVGPFFKRLFPEIPENHPATGQMLMSFSANMLGLDNAATPLGLKAINSMQELNKDKDTASNAQIMYLVFITSGMQLLPISIIAQRYIMKSADPTDVLIPCIIATFVSAIAGMLFVAFKQRIKLLDPVILAWLGGICLFIVAVVAGLSHLPKNEVKTISKVVSNLLFFLVPVIFIIGALFKRVNVFEAFIEGAKTGFDISIKIIPYLVAMLVGIAVFRACGALDYINDGLRWVCVQLHLDTRFVDAMPVAYLKPLSGSGSKGMMLTIMGSKGADSFAGHLACVLNGSSDTTFYIVALYFGSVGIKKMRYAIPAGLFADLAGIIAAIFISYLFFG